MSAALLAGLLAGYGIAVPVGAIAALIVGLTARTSLRVGAAAALGVAAADGVYATVATLGGAAVARVIQPAAGPLRWLAAGVLLVIAVRTGVDAVRRRGAPARARDANGRLGTPTGAFLGLLGLTLLNPMTIVYFGALVLGSGSGRTVGVAEQVAFVLAAFVASASWQLLLACGGSLLGRVLTGARGQLATAMVSSTVVALLAVNLLR